MKHKKGQMYGRMTIKSIDFRVVVNLVIQVPLVRKVLNQVLNTRKSKHVEMKIHFYK